MPTVSAAPTCSVSSDNNVVKAEVFIAAPRERVFQAFTDPRQAGQWWGSKDRYICTEFIIDLRVGGKWMSKGVSPARGEFSVEGEYLEVDPPRFLAYTWVATWMADLTTRVFVELQEKDSGTLVKVTHTGFAGNAEQVNAHGQGWLVVMGWLQAFVERGEKVADRG